MRSPVTVDMLEAFVMLADTLNLKETAERLGTTRQTVRRHIDALEDIKGGPLFGLDRQSYVMTERGQASLSGARALLAELQHWIDKGVVPDRGLRFLESSEVRDTEGRPFYSQQHPVSQVSVSGPQVMQDALSSWGRACARVEDAEFDAVRPHLVMYRWTSAGWVCVAVGEESAYAKWFGWTWAKSAIGRLLYEDNAGDDINAFISEAYQRIYFTGGVRHDHLFAYLPRPNVAEPVAVTFQRMLLGCIFPDGAPALAVLVVITDDVDIPALPKELKPDVSNLLSG